MNTFDIRNDEFNSLYTSRNLYDLQQDPLYTLYIVR